MCVLPEKSEKPVGSAGERSISLGKTQENQKHWQHPAPCQCAGKASAPAESFIWDNDEFNFCLVPLVTSHPVLPLHALLQLKDDFLELILMLGYCGLWSSGSSGPGTRRYQL